jgi:hypothetical protein
MIELVEAAEEVQSFCGARGWRFCFIGGLAVLHWGEIRASRDVDLTLLTGFGHEESFIQALCTQFQPRTPDAAQFALHSRVLLLQTRNGFGIDAALGALPSEESAVNRARKIEMMPGHPLRLCSPEDLIVFKAFAGQPLDWQGVRMTIVRQGEAKLDWPYVLKHLTPLAELKDQPEILLKLEHLRDEVRQSAQRGRSRA